MSQEKIRFCPLCATPVEYRQLFGEVHPVCPACNWIYFEDPKVAVTILVEKDDQILLTRRINEPYAGFWTLPGGFVNAREDPAEAARRECLEETGLQVKIGKILEVYTGREHDRGADIIIVYRAIIIAGELKAGDDADQANFFKRSSLPPLAFRATRLALGLEPTFPSFEEVHNDHPERTP